MRIATWNSTGRQLALATASFLVIGAVVAPSEGVAEQRAPAAEITCGGYAADGELLRPEAATVAHADIVGGQLAVPSICGGYAEDGEFIGDD